MRPTWNALRSIPTCLVFKKLLKILTTYQLRTGAYKQLVASSFYRFRPTARCLRLDHRRCFSLRMVRV